MCKNKTFNIIFFFSFVFFLISFVSHIMISYAATSEKNKQISIQENTTHIQLQQQQIINHLNTMEEKYGE